MGQNLGADPIGIGQELYEYSSTPKHELGARAVMHGREYRYVKAGASALVPGNVIQAPAQVTDHDQLTPSAAAIGATQITVTLGATLATENQYAGGLAVIDTTPGLGYHYPILSHPAADASAAVVLTLGQPIQVALTASSRVTLCPNRFRGVIQSPVTTLTGAIVGAAVAPVTAAYYGWIQTKGEAGVLIVGTPAVGQAISAPTTAAGAAAINSTTLPVIGAMMVTGVDGKVLPVMLDLP